MGLEDYYRYSHAQADARKGVTRPPSSRPAEAPIEFKPTDSLSVSEHNADTTNVEQIRAHHAGQESISDSQRIRQGIARKFHETI